MTQSPTPQSQDAERECPLCGFVEHVSSCPSFVPASPVSAAAPAGELVAKIVNKLGHYTIQWSSRLKNLPDGTALYTMPPVSAAAPEAGASWVIRFPMLMQKLAAWKAAGLGEESAVAFDALERELVLALTHPPAASEREGDWQPIETAPRDQFLLLAAEFDGPGDWRIKMGEFRTKVSDYGWHIMGASWAPTRWMPLPADPDAQRLGREKE